MFDNGLLKYFPEHATKDGLLNLKPPVFNMFPGVDDYRFLDYLETQEGIFYAKSVSKQVADAEILMGQIYNLLGLDCAVYLGGKEFETSSKITVVSNNVVKGNYVYAHDHFSKLEEKIGKYWCLDLPQRKIDNVIDYSKIITKEAMAKQIFMRIADVATRNIDRNTANFCYKIENGIITDLSLFDNGACSQPYIDRRYFHDFESSDNLSEYLMLAMVRDNENIRDYVSLESIANKIGSINIVDMAKDINQTTGYVLDKTFVDDTARQMDYVANALVCSDEQFYNM